MFENITDEQLVAELKRREEIKRQSQKPNQVMLLDPGPLRKICQEYIDQLAKNGYIDDDLEHYIFETGVESVFGKDVWVWINKQIE